MIIFSFFLPDRTRLFESLHQNGLKRLYSAIPSWNSEVVWKRKRTIATTQKCSWKSSFHSTIKRDKISISTQLFLFTGLTQWHCCGCFTLSETQYLQQSANRLFHENLSVKDPDIVVWQKTMENILVTKCCVATIQVALSGLRQCTWPADRAWWLWGGRPGRDPGQGLALDPF